MQANAYRNVAIIGDGGMGTVLSILLCEKGIPTRMWGHDAGQLAEIEKGRENKRFLPGYELPQSLVFEPRDERAMAGADLIVSAVPCQYMRPVWSRLGKHVPARWPRESRSARFCDPRRFSATSSARVFRWRP